MSDLTREQFALAVSTAIGGVKHLYRQVSLFNSTLVDSLRNGPDSLTPVARFRDVGKDNAYGRITIRDSFATLFQAGTDEEFADEDGDDDEEDLEPSPKRSRKVEIAATEPVLALSIVIASPNDAPRFEPSVAYAMIGDWQIDDAHPTISSMNLKTSMFRRLVLAFPPASAGSVSDRVYTRARLAGTKQLGKRQPGKISFRVMTETARVPLFDLNAPESVDNLAKDIKAFFVKNAASAK